MNKLLYSGPTARAPEYQCLRYINHTKSCPTYWHHIHLLTIPFFYHLHLETSHRPFHIITRLTPNIETTSVSYEIHGPPPRATRSRSPARAAEIPGALRQSEGLLLARMSDVIHHPTRYHVNTSAHDIYASNTIMGCKIYNPLRYNDIKPTFATE